MSDLFIGNSYYHFMVALESEATAMRRMKGEFSAKLNSTKSQLKATSQAAQLRVLRVGGRTIRQTNKTTLKRLAAEHEAAVLAQQAAEDFEDEYEYPARPESHDWPVRPNSSKRLLSPVKLGDLPHYSNVLRLPKDPPLIHGTGIAPTPATPPSPVDHKHHSSRPPTPLLRRLKSKRQ
jgi:hypothetical protein